MNAINELVEEHEAVTKTLAILKSIGRRAASTGKIDEPDHLARLFDFFVTFVDQCHHGKEEDLLFPALEAVGVSRTDGPIGVMLREHQRGRDLVAGMKTELVRFTRGEEAAAGQFKQHADEYADLLSRHIEKENKVLFPLAARHLSGKKLKELKEGFDRIEAEKIGGGRHEAFHAMIDTLAETYLKDASH